jgi:uncharacterized membrane protein YbhN (UPF0104 family)
LKNAKLIVSLIVLIVLVVFGIWAYRHVGFNFAAFRAQLSHVAWFRIAIGLACIYLGYVLRSIRWAFLLRHIKKIGIFSLTGTQVIGFTAVALIGRVADLVRPYLVSKKVELPLSSQIAVYVVERLFDAGSMALIFSIAMLGVPQEEILKATSHSHFMQTMSAHSPAMTAFLARYGGLALTVLGALFLFLVRMSGEAVARFCEATLGLISKKLGTAIADKIRTFRAGLDTMRSFSDFASTAVLSITMWALIAVAYFEVLSAFTDSPQLASVSPSKCVLMMIASGSASIIQLPVIGWFTQIGIVAAVLSSVLGASVEASTACAAMLLIVTFLGIVPVGLIWAQFSKISLRKISADSEKAGEEVKDAGPMEAPGEA